MGAELGSLFFSFERFPGEKPRGGVGNETYHSLVPALISNIKRDIKLVHYCKELVSI